MLGCFFKRQGVRMKVLFVLIVGLLQNIELWKLQLHLRCWMSKIIIHNNASELSDYAAINMVSRVIADGKVSGLGNKDTEQYCYATTFKLVTGLTIVIACFRRKAVDTYTFKVYREHWQWIAPSIEDRAILLISTTKGLYWLYLKWFDHGCRTVHPQ